MNVQTYIEQNQVFTLAQFRSEFGDGHTPYNLLVRAVRSGGADRVMRGVYVSRSGEHRLVEPDPYLVASAVTSDSVLAYHTALELHGLAHSPSRRVQYMSSTAVAPFTYRGYEYRRYGQTLSTSSATAGEDWSVLISRSGSVVRATSRERTLVDCLGSPSRAGGFEELFRSLASVPFVDARSVVAYLLALGSPPTAASRVGWLLARQAGNWYVGSEEIEAIRLMLGRGPYYLSSNPTTAHWNPEWRLYTPLPGEQYDEWLRG